MKNTASNQKGITLVELMIAMVISLFLVGGIATVYMSSKRNYQTRDQFSIMDESARVALTTLTQSLEHAGYATPAKLLIGDYFYVAGSANPVAGSCGTLQSLSLAAIKKSATADAAFTSADSINRDGDNSYGDAISVRFIGDQFLNQDVLKSTLPAACQGGAVSVESALVYNGFHIDTSPSVKDSLGNPIPILYAAGSNKNQNKQPIVNGIQNMQLMYGIDTNADGAVDKYANASSVAAGEWQQVISIKVGLLVRSLEPVWEQATTQNFTVLDKAVSFNDRYKRSVYTTVIQLRNVVDG